MKVLLVGEYIEKKLQETTYELLAFADKIGADEKVMVVVGSETDLPKFDGTLYFADSDALGEYNPLEHKNLVLEIISKENPDVIVFIHSSYGWDLGPRVATALKIGQITEVVDFVDGNYVVQACNAKLRRDVKSKADKTIVTIQAGAFGLEGDPSGVPQVQKIDIQPSSDIEFVGYEEAEAVTVDLSKADVIVTAGRGVGKADNISVVKALADALGGQLGASRPVVDNGWVDHSHQVGTTGQSVSPKLYVACGVSGAVQHVAGMKKSEFVVAINKDKDAAFGEVADVLVVADLLQFIPTFVEKIRS